jgi:hypothetical protein
LPNGRTDDIWVGSQFLHNTKIVTSAINESKDFQSKRYSSYPMGTEVPDIYCLHLILGYPEVTTNMTFIQNNTGPFENCTLHTVRLDQCDNVIAVMQLVMLLVSVCFIIQSSSRLVIFNAAAQFAPLKFMLDIHQPSPRDINGP